ncbi:MAG: DUF4003 family protein [Clostridiales bacterium]|nr:DUF4003 family protein [Clostridiales bacterium]
MIDQVRERCDLLLSNSRAINKKFFLEENLMGVAAGLIFASEGKTADVDKMASCRKILKKNTRPLSNLRATVELVLLSKMALSEDPQKYLSDVLDAYDKLQKGKLLENNFMALAAILIVDFGCQEESDAIIEKAHEITKRMNKEHPILTDSEDTSFIMLLALSDKRADAVLSDLEEGYTYLKKTHKVSASSDVIYELCEVLALSFGDMQEKCDQAMRIYSAFAAKKAKLGSDHAFSSLGILLDVDLDTESLVKEILEVEAYMEGWKGFGEKEIDQKKRIMYASFIVSDVCGKSSAASSNPAISNTLSIIRAKKISTMISIVGSVAPSVITAFLPDSEESSKEDGTKFGKH